jgi:hypothetical protein
LVNAPRGADLDECVPQNASRLGHAGVAIPPDPSRSAQAGPRARD